MKISGNSVLITGGGSGIGFQLALAFVQNGSTVLITGRNESKLQTACQILGKAEYIVCDVTNERHIKTLAEEHGKNINVLVNNAGRPITPKAERVWNSS